MQVIYMDDCPKNDYKNDLKLVERATKAVASQMGRDIAIRLIQSSEDANEGLVLDDEGNESPTGRKSWVFPARTLVRQAAECSDAVFVIDVMWGTDARYGIRLARHLENAYRVSKYRMVLFTQAERDVAAYEHETLPSWILSVRKPQDTAEVPSWVYEVQKPMDTEQDAELAYVRLRAALSEACHLLAQAEAEKPPSGGGHERGGAAAVRWRRVVRLLNECAESLRPGRRRDKRAKSYPTPRVDLRWVLHYAIDEKNTQCRTVLLRCITGLIGSGPTILHRVDLDAQDFVRLFAVILAKTSGTGRAFLQDKCGLTADDINVWVEGLGKKRTRSYDSFMSNLGEGAALKVSALLDSLLAEEAAGESGDSEAEK